MNITLVISSLSCGGAERVSVLLAEGFVAKGHQVTLITIAGKERDFYKLSPKVSRLALNIAGASHNAMQALRNNLHRCLVLRKAIKSTNPDLVISHLVATNLLTILSLLKTNLPTIITEHSYGREKSDKRKKYTLRKLVYKYANKLVSVSKELDQSFQWLNPNKRVVIYNPIVKIPENDLIEDHVLHNLGIDSHKNWITSMGRLTKQKGFDILISAFSKIAHKYPDWQILIIGEGHLKSELLALINKLNLSAQVVLVGRLSNPFPVLKKSELFVMASRWEGFPMVHCEALACGLPVIATDCPTGPKEIIRHNVDGVLVPNEDSEALATAMENLMSNSEERQRLASRATEVNKRFALEKILQDWEKLFENVSK
ncbi:MULTISPECIES: glycosyltransferase family 4 protein [Moorena]|uniref:Glycosyltransferase n=1 Tax=Moorena producens 3L TaxID=489825 RepID=F4XSR5_9CYAN|nr:MULTISPECIES: glycosyltransferase family 4 protein [Moorena]EGJ32390.1 glycosyltransferase [Moorena producens 3L]NEP68576.1 glycosyltransferase family 4 protein [Moorena sp. SIO3A5]OLT64384.1 glycosyltransferase [Moorena producens 3L]